MDAAAFDMSINTPATDTDLKDRIADISFCARCAAAPLAAWRGWPLRDALPIPPVMEHDACPVCHGHEALHSTSIAWLNIHEEGNTGLPDYWILVVGNRTEFVRDFPSRWGLPYFESFQCPRCGGPAFSSLLIPPSNWEVRHKCSACAYTKRERSDRK